MNTPRSKPPRRWGQLHRPYKASKQPDGSYRTGLHDDRFLIAVGRIASYFPLLETDMIYILGELLGAGGQSTARQIFTSISSHNGRVKVMTSLLEESLVNKDKGQQYDQMILDFKSVAKSRNDYVHNIWWTHSSGRVFLAESGPEHFSTLHRREVTLKEIDDVSDRMADLMWRVRDLRYKNAEQQQSMLASLGIQLQPRVEDNGSLPPAPPTIAAEHQPQLQPSDPSPQSDNKA